MSTCSSRLGSSLTFFPSFRSFNADGPEGLSVATTETGAVSVVGAAVAWVDFAATEDGFFWSSTVLAGFNGCGGAPNGGNRGHSSMVICGCLGGGAGLGTASAALRDGDGGLGAVCTAGWASTARDGDDCSKVVDRVTRIGDPGGETLDGGKAALVWVVPLAGIAGRVVTPEKKGKRDGGAGPEGAVREGAVA